PLVSALLAAAAIVAAAGWSHAAWRLRQARRSAPPTRPASFADARAAHVLAEESARFGVWEFDSLSNMVRLSAGAARLSGFLPAPLSIGVEELGRQVHPDDLGASRRVFEAALREGGDYQVEYRMRCPDGAFFWRRVQSHAKKVGDRLVLVVGAFIDIHDEKRRVQDLAETAARLALAEEAGGVGLWDIDMEAGTVTYSAGAAA